MSAAVRLNRPCLLGTLLFVAGCAAAEPVEHYLDSEHIHAAAKRQYDTALRSLRDFLAVPNNARQQSDISAVLDWLRPQLDRRGFRTSLWATPGQPLLFGYRPSPGATRDLLIYLQADGQPVDPSAWDQDDPYEAVLKREVEGEWRPVSWDELDAARADDWRIFARSAADAKGPIVQFLAAIDAMTQEGLHAAYNLKVIVDTEEELGSPHLEDVAKAQREELRSEALLVFDGPLHRSDEPTLILGARGIAIIQLITYGPRAPQHSGHYGNFVPNPARRLAQLLASMTFSDGRVSIPGFYEGVDINDDILASTAETSRGEASLLDELGIATPDAVGKNLYHALLYPSLNIRGMNSGWVGEHARTIIPATATAELDIRLVPGVNAQQLIDRIRSHIVAQGFVILDSAPTEADRRAHDRLVQLHSVIAYPAFRTDPSAAIVTAIEQTLERVHGRAPRRILSSGGSVPVSPLATTLNVPTVIVPTVNADNNQHSPNENIRVGTFKQGIATLIGILTMNVTEPQ